MASYTLDEVIATLESLRDQIGGKAQVYLAESGERGGCYGISAVYRTRGSGEGVAIYRTRATDRRGEERFQQGGKKRIAIIRK